MPDYTSLGTYKYGHVRDTPLQIDNHQRAVDDFQTRKQLKLAFAEGKLTLDDDEKINDFCNKFIVDRALVVKRLEAMQWSKFRKPKTEEERKEEEMKKYSDFIWVKLAGGKGLDKLKVKSSNKYLHHHMLLHCPQTEKKKKRSCSYRIISNQQILHRAT